MISAIGNHLWQSTVFAAAVAVLTIALRHQQARVRYALWLAASLKFLVPFSLLIAVGGEWHWAPAARRLAPPVVASTMIDVSTPFVQEVRGDAAAPSPLIA